MNYNIDELYDLLMWDSQLSKEENEAKEKKGIDAAQQIKNLYPFIQPIVAPPGHSKMVWEGCAKIVAARSDEELEPFMYKLLEWIQDLNWPGARIIYERLAQMPFHTIESPFKHSRIEAEQTKDTDWLEALDYLYEKITKKA
ncbi:MAG: DUF5071 domain-containing protein [Clostridia bacterium]|nr:DUF5071 domain-containing protein [Clostridia bacterium]